MPPPTRSEEQVFANITAQRRLEGIEFNLRSPGLEALFKHLSGDSSVAARAAARPATPRRPDEGERRVPVTNYSGPTRRYQLQLGDNGLIPQLVGFSQGRFDMWGSPELLLNRGPRLNLSMFTALGLGEGVNVMIPTVMSDKLITEFLNGVESALRQMYIDYIADRTHAIEIVTTHIIEE